MPTEELDEEGNLVYTWEEGFDQDGQLSEVIIKEMYFGEFVKTIRTYEYIGEMPRIISKKTFPHPNMIWKYDLLHDKIQVENITHPCFTVKRVRKYFYESNTEFFPNKVIITEGDEERVEEYFYEEENLLEGYMFAPADIVFENHFLELDHLQFVSYFEWIMPPVLKGLIKINVTVNNVMIEKHLIEKSWIIEEVVDGVDDFHIISEVSSSIFENLNFLLKNKTTFVFPSSRFYPEEPYNIHIEYFHGEGDYKETSTKGKIDCVEAQDYNSIREYLISKQCKEVCGYVSGSFESVIIRETPSCKSSTTYFIYDDNGLLSSEKIVMTEIYIESFIDEDYGHEYNLLRKNITTDIIDYTYYENGLKSIHVKKNINIMKISDLTLGTDDIIPHRQLIDVIPDVTDFQKLYFCHFSELQEKEYCMQLFKNVYNNDGRLIFHLDGHGGSISIQYVDVDGLNCEIELHTYQNKYGIQQVTIKNLGAFVDEPTMIIGFDDLHTGSRGWFT
jgi:hypothetical protein